MGNKVELLVNVDGQEFRRMMNIELVDVEFFPTANPQAVEMGFDVDKTMLNYRKELAAKLREIADEIDGTTVNGIRYVQSAAGGDHQQELPRVYHCAVCGNKIKGDFFYSEKTDEYWCSNQCLDLGHRK